MFDPNEYNLIEYTKFIFPKKNVLSGILLGNVHLNLGQNPNLRVANSKVTLNHVPSPTSEILHLNSSKIHKFRPSMKKNGKKKGMKRVLCRRKKKKKM